MLFKLLVGYQSFLGKNKTIYFTNLSQKRTGAERSSTKQQNNHSIQPLMGYPEDVS